MHLSKSNIFFGNVPQAAKVGILNYSSLRMDTFPVADFGVLVSKVRNRILNWKSKFLSFGGCKQPIVSITVYVFPSTIIHELEALLSGFPVVSWCPSKGRCHVAWFMACRPKEFRALGGCTCTNFGVLTCGWLVLPLDGRRCCGRSCLLGLNFLDAWTSRFPTLVDVSLHVLCDNAQDGLTWNSDTQGEAPFSVSVVYSALDGDHAPGALAFCGLVYESCS
ncbi:hypothetical protein OSB04_012943 [Centaurea solstitialis]|uniref:Uncharacterized protein n=1 Tax=Centaurea solstitialis TaxID=347529 RepID=A0AA38TCB0_9ASTR|nr:hypothetical protein OSB04_012943 [Centaurea solstitialis]